MKNYVLKENCWINYVRLYYGIICNVLKYILLVISDKNKMQTCVNQNEYQLANVPKKIRRWTGFLHDCMQSFGQWHLSRDSPFFVLILLLSNCSSAMACNDLCSPSLRTPWEDTSFLVVTAKVLVLLAWLKSRANSWDKSLCVWGQGDYGCLGLNYAPIAGAQWWSQPYLSCMN